MDIESLTEIYVAAYEKALEMTGNTDFSVQTAYSILSVIMQNSRAMNDKSAKNVATLVANVLAINKRNAKQDGESK